MRQSRPVVVFSGPTIAPEEVQAIMPDCHCLGPAARGDLLAAALQFRPQVICLIDGYFEHRPAVSHKEILWLLTQGIAVYGAASMGALRAAELGTFGMLGRGQIFRAYAQGELEDEDEVCVPHELAPSYRTSAVALVNIRATLAAAHGAGVISEELRRALVRVAKELFYADRHYDALLERMPVRAREELSPFVSWLQEPGALVDQKRRDAEELLREVHDSVIAGAVPVPHISWEFCSTSNWRALVEEVSSRLKQNASPVPRSIQATTQKLAGTEGEGGDSVSISEVSEELQLMGPGVYLEFFAAAAIRALGERIQDAESTAAGGGRESESWGHLAKREAAAQLPSVLQALGNWEAVRERVRRKRAVCGPPQESAPLASEGQVREYLERRLSLGPVQDLESISAELGFGSAADLARAIAREMNYQRRLNEP